MILSVNMLCGCDERISRNSDTKVTSCMKSISVWLSGQQPASVLFRWRKTFILVISFLSVLLKPSFPVIFLFDPLWSHNTCESLVITSVNKNRKDGTNNCLYSLLFFMLYLRCPTSLFFSSICIRRGYILSVSCWFNACQCVSHLCSKIKVRDAIPFFHW